MPVPSGPRANLVVVEPDLTFGLFETGFNGPARAGNPHQFRERRHLRRECQIEGELAWRGDLAADQQALLPAGSGLGAIR